jgi:putative DNA primase/helicase
LLNVENGTVDLSTGTIYPHNRAHRITKICRAAYAPNAQAPLFRKFLARIFRTHPALIDYMQRVIGYAATGLTTEQAFFFMHGGGQNGKTTLFDIATYILGDYAGKAAPDLLMTRDKSAHPCDVADLQGLRLAVASETREGRRFDGARLKELTGETRLKARLMRENFFEFTPTHKVFLYSNHKPIVQETDFGFWRRMRLIPFVESIGEHEKDPDLLDKLKAEADGILAWIVAGAVRWHREGLGTPPEVAAATHEYRTEMDTIGAFLGECCVEDKDAAVYATPIYETYRRWAEEHGERVESQKRFGTLLRERGYRSDRCSRTGRQVWYGIRVNETTTSGRIIFN